MMFSLLYFDLLHLYDLHYPPHHFLNKMLLYGSIFAWNCMILVFVSLQFFQIVNFVLQFHLLCDLFSLNIIIFLKDLFWFLWFLWVSTFLKLIHFPYILYLLDPHLKKACRINYPHPFGFIIYYFFKVLLISNLQK